MTNNKHSRSNDITERVMQKITSGEVTMRPRSYYIIIGLVATVVSLLLASVLTYTTSLLMFWIRLQMAAGPAYGVRRNLEAISEQFPWWALILAAALLVGLVYVVRRFGELYRLRWQTVALAIVTLAMALGLALSYTNLPIYGPGQRSLDCQPGVDCGPRGQQQINRQI